MNTFSLVLILPTLLTAVTASTLYFSFKGKVDVSGRYFLLAEFLWLAVLLITIAFNAQLLPPLSTVFFVFTFCGLFSEVAILLSIQALMQRVLPRSFIFWLLFVLAYCGFIEYCRYFINPKLPLLLVSLFSLTVTSITYIVCRQSERNGLEGNLFLKWITYAELGLTVIHLLRFASFFSDAPMMAINPSPLAIIIFSIWLTINLFRYFSYQSLRISWVDPRGIDDNPLNQNLVKLVKEKNQFLQGLISSNRALGISALANSLAHQLSQPIQGILLQAESVKRDLIDLGTQKKSVNVMTTITEQLGRLSELVNNLRRLFASRQAEFKPFDLQTSCDEILEIIDPTLKSKNIALHKVYESDPIALGDPIQIQQVLINLFNNAIDAIEISQTKERFIRLRITQDQDFAVLEIQDSGSGIDKVILPKIFELYQSTKPNGLGIGLWLSKTIVDHHDGTITAINSDNGGAIFRIQLPLAK